jgi:hypothetical protein
MPRLAEATRKVIHFTGPTRFVLAHCSGLWLWHAGPARCSGPSLCPIAQGPTFRSVRSGPTFRPHRYGPHGRTRVLRRAAPA